LAFTGCKKEIQNPEFDSIDGGIAFPLAYASLTINNMISDTSEFINIDSDGSIHFSYRQDSITTLDTTGLFSLPPQDPQNQEFKVGIIELDDFGPITAEATLGELLESLDTTMASYVQSLDGTVSIVPSLQSTSASIFEFSDFDDFEYVTFSEGTITLTIKNNLPIDFANASVQLKTLNTDSIPFDVGAFTFTNLLAGQSDQEAIVLNGMTLYNNFEITILNYETVETPTAVPVDLAVGLEFTVNSENLKVIAGKAKVPAQSLSNLAENTDLSFDTEQRLQFLKVSEASLSYSINSSVTLPVIFTIGFPTAEINSSPVSFDIDFLSQPSDVFNLDGAQFDLTQGTDPYNYLPVDLSLSTSGSSTWIEFDSATTMDISYSMYNLKFELVKGWLGVIEVPIDQEVIDIGMEQLEQITGTIYLEDPKIHLLVDNNIGVPLGLNMELDGVSASGTNLSLNSDMLMLHYPIMIGDSVSGEKVTISNNNSQLSDFLANIPSELNFSGIASTNPDSANTGVVYTNFITNKAKLQLGLEIELPMALSIDQLSFSDTLDISISEMDVEKVTSGHLSILTINGMPMEVDADIHFMDSVAGTILETIEVDILNPASVDINGEVTANEKHTIVELTSDQIKNLAKGDKAIFSATVNTENNAIQTFYSDYSFDMKVGILVRYEHVFQEE